jgi:hypothetical protein
VVRAILDLIAMTSRFPRHEQAQARINAGRGERDHRRVGQVAAVLELVAISAMSLRSRTPARHHSA